MFSTETRWIWVAIVLAVIGMGISAVLMEHHVAAKVGADAALFSSICEEGDKVSCDEVIASRWGTVLGLPTALWGFIFFAGLFSWYMIIGVPTGRARRLNAWPFLALLSGVGGCGFLAYNMYVELDQLCPLCAMIHVITLLLFIVSIAVWLHRSRRVPRDAATAGEITYRPSPRAALGFVLLTAAMSFSAWSEYDRSIQARTVAAYQRIADDREQALAQAAVDVEKSRDIERELAAQRAQTADLEAEKRRIEQEASGDEERLAELERELAQSRTKMNALQQESAQYQERWQEYHREYLAKYRSFLEQDIVDIPIEADDPILGNPDAPNTVVAFSDVLCPFCGTFERMFTKQINAYGDDVRFVFKHFPMETGKDRNPHISRTLHRGAYAAAWTVEAARILGGEELYWKMLDRLMERRQDFGKQAEDTVNAIAAEFGMDKDEIWRKIRSTESHTRVDRNVEEGGAIGVQGTPLVYLNGRKVNYLYDEHFWRFALRDAKDLNVETQPATQPATPPESNP